jgi:hypothetical protein
MAYDKILHTDINKIINDIYKNDIPTNVICYIINFFIKKNTTIKNYKIHNMIIKNNVKYYDNNNCITESISFIDNYSPLLEYYNNRDIKYEEIDNVDLSCQFNKIQLISKFKFSLDNFLNNISLLDEQNLFFYNFINNLVNYDYDTWKIFINIKKDFSIRDLTFIIDNLKIKNISKKDWDMRYLNKKCKIFLQ